MGSYLDIGSIKDQSFLYDHQLVNPGTGTVKLQNQSELDLGVSLAWHSELPPRAFADNCLNLVGLLSSQSLLFSKEQGHTIVSSHKRQFKWAYQSPRGKHCSGTLSALETSQKYKAQS